MFSCHQMAALWYYCKPQDTVRLQPKNTVTAPQAAQQSSIITHKYSIFMCPLLHCIHLWLEVMSPRFQRVSPLPLPVTLFPPLWPGETTLSGPVGLIILITVAVRLSCRENSVRENFFQLGGEKRLQTAACLGHFRIRLWSERERAITQISTTEGMITSIYNLNWEGSLIIMIIIVITVWVKLYIEYTQRLSNFNLHNWTLHSCET